MTPAKAGKGLSSFCIHSIPSGNHEATNVLCKRSTPQSDPAAEGWYYSQRWNLSDLTKITVSTASKGRAEFEPVVFKRTAKLQHITKDETANPLALLLDVSWPAVTVPCKKQQLY